MGKGSTRQKKSIKNTKFDGRRQLQSRGGSVGVSFGEKNMDDEIDAFHKQQDVVPIDINFDAGGASDEDDEQPVFDFKGQDDDTDASDSSSTGGGSDNDYNDDDNDAIAGHSKDYVKMMKQKKILQQKYGVEDDAFDDTDQEEEQKAFFGRGKQFLYGADNVDFEIQSDDEDLAEEEAIAVMSQKEKAKYLSMEDFGLEDIDKGESDDDNQDISHVFGASEDDTFVSHEEIKKDLNALSNEEQMDVVYSTAPELVGLLSELNEAINQLYRVKSLLCKVKETKGSIDYLETKHKLLLAYLQAICFYLLLKSEGHSVCDHPLIGRLVEIKNLWEKVKNMEGIIPSQVEDIIDHEQRNDAKKSWVKDNVVPEFEPAVVSTTAKTSHTSELSEVIKSGLSKKDHDSKGINQKPQNGQIGQQSMEMLKVRAILEDKLNKRGVFNSVTTNANKVQNQVPETVNRYLETLADFDDDVADIGVLRGVNNRLHKILPMKVKTPTFVSGDDDLPMRENIGEKRIKYDRMVVQKAEKERNHESRALTKTKAGSVDGSRDVGVSSMDADMQDDGGILESEDEFYKEAKKQRLTKLSAKATLYSRTPVLPPSLEIDADGKRQITYQMEKNKGLTRDRKKLTKIPRKKYKIKHQKAVVRRRGQVRDIRKPTGPYGGEASGINTRVSRSVRFKS